MQQAHIRCMEVLVRQIVNPLKRHAAVVHISPRSVVEAGTSILATAIGSIRNRSVFEDALVHLDVDPSTCQFGCDPKEVLAKVTR